MLTATLWPELNNVVIFSSIQTSVVALNSFKHDYLFQTQDLRRCIYNYTIMATDQEGNVYAQESLFSYICNDKLCSYTFTNLIPPTRICAVTVTASLATNSSENSSEVLAIDLGMSCLLCNQNYVLSAGGDSRLMVGRGFSSQLYIS